MNKETAMRTSVFFLQPSDWNELDSEWSDRVESLEEGLRLRDDSNGTLALWELRWQDGDTVRL
jgi:hypothetical protein